MQNNIIICSNIVYRRKDNTICEKSFVCLDQDGRYITEQPEESISLCIDKE